LQHSSHFLIPNLRIFRISRPSPLRIFGKTSPIFVVRRSSHYAPLSDDGFDDSLCASPLFGIMACLMPDFSPSVPDSNAPPAPATGAEPILREAPPAVSGDKPTPALTIRIWSAFAFSICAGMLGVGLWLTPSPTGTGTHRELGLPPCAFFERTGYPCPTCGCTTAVSHFAHGQFLSSLLTQPFGFCVALVALLILPLAAWGVISGKWRGPSMFTMGWYWQFWLYGGLTILLLAWAYKIISVKTGHG
jgi:hypothetical protein